MARQCRTVLVLPSSDGRNEVRFQCTRPADHDPAPEGAKPNHMHQESGRVRTRSGTVRSYDISWYEEDAEVWRMAKPNDNNPDPS